MKTESKNYVFLTIIWILYLNSLYLPQIKKTRPNMNNNLTIRHHHAPDVNIR